MKKVYYVGKDNKIKAGDDYGVVENDKFYCNEWSYNKQDLKI